MDLGIKGRVALVTGGARSLGKADCFALAAEGCKIVVLDLNAEGATATAAEITGQGGNARGYEVDITDRGRLAEVVEGAQSEVGPVDSSRRPPRSTPWDSSRTWRTPTGT
jgi:NAD(P)-dependent dehydrogenase (short-subunit alcohol dehydrogenase family)